MKAKTIEQLQSDVCLCALRRYKRWIKEHPEGLVHPPHPLAHRQKDARDLIAATGRLADAMKANHD